MFAAELGGVKHEAGRANMPSFFLIGKEEKEAA